VVVVVLGWIVVRLLAMLGLGRVRVETGCLMELGCWRWSGGQLRDAMEGLRQGQRGIPWVETFQASITINNVNHPSDSVGIGMLPEGMTARQRHSPGPTMSAPVIPIRSSLR
jgi:hypothetical protein